jgi:hypothetical protein
MKTTLLLAAAAMMLAAPAFAAGGCSTASADKFQPKSKLEEQLKSTGVTVKRIKVENGCYEVYATDKTGKRVNAAYNAETLAKVDNPEAGEN